MESRHTPPTVMATDPDPFGEDSHFPCCEGLHAGPDPDIELILRMMRTCRS
ncbi:MAG: hypothetical protein IKR71_09590 [Bacteroidales bacterium]|nr:hypothetical protein [Bacteroidales bacterium]